MVKAKTAKAAKTLTQSVADLREEVERLRVQLAGCGVAALGYATRRRGTYQVKKSDWGWSSSLEQVMYLFEKFRSAEKIVEMTEHLIGLESDDWKVPSVVKDKIARIRASIEKHNRLTGKEKLRKLLASSNNIR